MSDFTKQLQRLHRAARLSRLCIAILLTLAITGSLIFLIGLSDFFFAWESPARRNLLLIAAGIALILLLWQIVKAIDVKVNTVAITADQLLADPRRPASAGLTLPPPDATPLAAYLHARALAESAEKIAHLPSRRMIPWIPLRRVMIALFILGAAFLACAVIQPAAFATVASRLRYPSADIAPYSPMRFVISPEAPTSVYGGSVEIHCEITGAVPKHNIECLILDHHTGKILRLPAYRENAQSYSRTITNVTDPISIAFACQKARSPWLPVTIVLEPDILGGSISITPPAYTGLSPSTSPLESDEISALTGSTITLKLDSNRPLGSATLTLTPDPTTNQAAQTVQAEISAHTASFTWQATQSGAAVAIVKDIRGTPSPRPLTFHFRATADLAPSISLNSPASMMLATPESRIPVEGFATDDFALSKIHFIRTLSGFRERVLPIAASLQEKRYEFRDILNLEELGLQPGQTIELFIDAQDHNPTMLGQASSNVSRIQIISKEKYAELIRARTAISNLQNKHSAARDAMDAARESLEKLRDAVQKNNPEEVAKAAKAAADAHRKAVDTLKRVAEDFPAFKIEKELSDLAEQQQADLEENLRELEKFDPQAPAEEQKQQVEDFIERAGKREEQQEKIEQDFAAIKEQGIFIELAMRFRSIHVAQASLLKRLDAIVRELQQGMDRNRTAIPLLGETQEKNRQALLRFTADLKAAIEKAPKDEPALEEMLGSATDFLTELENAAPQAMMENASKHAAAGRAGDTLQHVLLAFQALDRLLKMEGLFAETARGESRDFNEPDPDVNQTLEELLKALLQQQQQQEGENQPGDPNQRGGPAQGQGMGRAGGFSFMNIPMIGPERSQFQSLGGDGKGNGETPGGAPPPPLPTEAALSSRKVQEFRQGNSSAPSSEAIPDSYRDAVKNFLSDQP